MQVKAHAQVTKSTKKIKNISGGIKTFCIFLEGKSHFHQFHKNLQTLINY